MSEIPVLSLTPDLKIPPARMPTGYIDQTTIQGLIDAATSSGGVDTAAVNSLIAAALQAKTVAFNIAGSGGTFTVGRHIGGNPELFFGPNPPPATGQITGGGGMVPELDLWFELKAA